MNSNKIKIKRGDTVIVTIGKDAGKTGKVLQVFPREEKLVVDGVNVVTKSKKPRSAQEKGGFVKINQKIHVSNVILQCPGCKKGTRVGYKDEKGKKVRFCKKCDKVVENKYTKGPIKMDNPTVAIKQGKEKEPIKKEDIKKVEAKTAKKEKILV